MGHLVRKLHFISDKVFDIERARMNGPFLFVVLLKLSCPVRLRMAELSPIMNVKEGQSCAIKEQLI